MRATSRLRAALAAGLLVATLAGCSSSGSAPSDALQDAGQPEAAALGAPEAAPADEQREIVITGRLTLVTDDVAAAAQEVAEVAEAAGGRVEARHESTDGDDPTASLTIRVPADATSGTVAAFGDLGTVQDTDLESADMTGTARDLDARISALQASVARLEGLMSEAATTADLLAAESELNDRQAQLESLQAQRTLLADQVAMSTLTVQILSTPPPAAESRGGFLGGLESGWNALGDAAGWLVTVLGALLPWAVVAAVVTALVVVARRWLRRHRPPAPAPGPMAPTMAAMPVPVGATPGPAQGAGPGTPYGAAPAAGPVAEPGGPAPTPGPPAGPPAAPPVP